MNPKYQPKIVLQTSVYRIVHDPSSKCLYIEKVSKDSMGGARWDLLHTLYNSDWRSAEVSMQQHVVDAIYTLVMTGVRPDQET